MKAQDWFAVILMCLVGAVCAYYAIDATISDEVICLSRGCTRHILLSREPELFYLNVGGLLILAGVTIGASVKTILVSV